MSFNHEDYCQYLLSSQTNYTLTNLAEHLQTFSHDTINRYLRKEQLTSDLLWQNVKPDQGSTTAVKTVCALRWKIEQFHRELKQLTGIESCQCRRAQIQRNHIEECNFSMELPQKNR